VRHHLLIVPHAGLLRGDRQGRKRQQRETALYHLVDPP
jgi:hypothetical protein